MSTSTLLVYFGLGILIALLSGCISNQKTQGLHFEGGIPVEGVLMYTDS